jgi:hypothetical protein
VDGCEAAPGGPLARHIRKIRKIQFANAVKKGDRLERSRRTLTTVPVHGGVEPVSSPSLD